MALVLNLTSESINAKMNNLRLMKDALEEIERLLSLFRDSLMIRKYSIAASLYINCERVYEYFQFANYTKKQKNINK